VNVRSVRFRLLALYAGMFLVVCAMFGAYTYWSLRHYIYSVLEGNLRRRANQLGASLLLNAEKTGDGFVVEQIRTLYGPELNGRFIRISRPDGSQLYASGTPYDMSFEPARVPNIQVAPGEMKLTSLSSEHLLLVSKTFNVRGGEYLIEVGASTLEAEDVLRGFVLTLVLGLPAVLGLAVAGGAVLVKNALAPVDRVIAAAREITFHNLSRRLPVLGTRDEIANLSTVLNEMIERLEGAFQHAARFSADASHELRTPLTVIRGELEGVVQDPSLAERHRVSLGSVLEETVRLTKIVNDLLAIGRLEAGETLLERSRFDLGQMVVATVDQMGLLAEEKGLQVGCLGSERVEVEGDRARLTQVVVNLLDNAIKYTPAGGRVWLETRRVEGTAVLEVGDTGPGIPEVALSRVFDRFFRVDPVRTAEGGSGLGLAIVRQICAAHGGSVSVANDPSGGCRVRVSLPLAVSPSPRSQPAMSGEGALAGARISPST
jgi:heavy metal sensor kinase